MDIAKGAGANFGAYYLDGATRGADLNLQLTADGRYSAFDADGNAVQFNPGDAIGFWYEDANGKIVYNTPGLEGEHRQTYNATWIKDQDTYMIGFGEYGQYINSRNPDQIYGESAFVMDVQVGGTAPTGQPLPGVLATLLIGGAVATGRRLYPPCGNRNFAFDEQECPIPRPASTGAEYLKSGRGCTGFPIFSEDAHCLFTRNRKEKSHWAAL